MSPSSRQIREALHGLRLSVVVWGFGYLLVALAMSVQGRASFPLALLSQLPLFLVGITVAVLVHRVFVWGRGRRIAVRWASMTAALLCATVAITAVDLGYHYWLGQTIVPAWREWASLFVPPRVFSVALLYLWTLCLSSTLFWTTDINEAARRQEARAIEAESAAHRAEAAALRLQLNPHFLFNTLNAIASLVVTRRNKDAEEMISRLADFLRASLASEPDGLVRLTEEIATVEAYLKIESVRFGDRMSVSIDMPETLAEALVPNFILQPLVENAVKHGVAGNAGATAIQVVAQREGQALSVRVMNQSDGPRRRSRPRAEPRPRSGIGLANIRQRLEILYGAAGALMTEAGPRTHVATVLLPLIRQEI